MERAKSLDFFFAEPRNHTSWIVFIASFDFGPVEKESVVCFFVLKDI